MKTTMITRRLKSITLAGGALLALAVAAVAAERLSEPFTSPEGGVPNGWKVAKASPITVVEVRAAPEGGNALIVQRTPEGVGSAAVFYEGGGAGEPSAVLGDFTATVTLQMEQPSQSTSCTHGMLLRAARMSYKKSDGFYVAVNPNGDKAGIAIYRNPETHVVLGDPLAYTAISGLKAMEPYILQVRAKGNTIEGELWSVDAAGAKNTLLGKVQTDEATDVSEGYFALRNGLGNSGPVATWYKAFHLSTGGEE